MALNQTSTPFLPTSLLVADLTKFTGITGAQATSPDSVPTLTINPTTQLPVSAALEVQSTTGLLLVPRLTDAERDALITAVVPAPQVGAVPDPGNIINGMIYYNSDDENFVFYQNGGPVILPTGGGIGNVTGVNVVVDKTLAYYNGTNGLLIDQTSIGNLGGFNVLADELVVCAASGTANQVATYVGTTQTGGTGAIIQAATVTMAAGAIGAVTSIQNALGTVGLPSYTFTAFTNTGIYSASGGVSVDVAVGGIESLKVLSTAAQFKDGTAALPSITFLSETDTGLYRIGANTVGVGANGGTNFSVAGTIATAATYLTAAGAAATGTATASIATLTATSTDTNASINLVPKGIGAVLNAVGAVATPSYSFLGDADTGMWHSAANTLDFSANATRQLQIIGTAGAADYVTIAGAAAGGAPTIAAAGSDANIALNFVSKGTDGLLFATNNDAVNRVQLEILDGGATTTGHLTIQGGTGATPGIITLGALGTATNIDILVQPKGPASGFVIGAGSGGGLFGDLTLLKAGGALSISLTGPATVFTDQQAIELPVSTAGTPVATGNLVSVTAVDTSNPGTTVVTLGYSDAGFLTETIVISSAELLALTSSVTKTLVPAQGVGKIVTPFAMVMIYETPGADNYTISGGLRLVPSIGGVTIDNPTFNPVGFLDQTVGKVAGQALFVLGAAFTSSVLDNQPFVLATNNIAAGLTGGTGTLTIIVKYFVIDDGI